MSFRLLSIGLISAVVLAGCANHEVAPLEAVASARYVSSDAPSVSLITMINTRSESGEHSALLINGSEQVLYDPAGTFRHSRVPRREDMNYGMTPDLVSYYNSYHARFGFYVKVQTVEISMDLANALIARAQAEGAVGKLSCAHATSNILNDFEMFSHINTTYFPNRVMTLFDRLEDVDTLIVAEDDVGQNYN